MNSTFRRLGTSELLPRYVFAEALFSGRRVLEVGAVASTGGRTAQFLALRGARSVLSCDSDLGAVDAAQKSLGGPNLHFRANVFEDLETGSFDLALIADWADCLREPHLVRELRRLLAQTGFALGGLRNPAGLALSQLVEPEPSDGPATYGQLLDALEPHFRHVDVATQSPVLGYQVAFERGEGLQVDGSLASAGEAAYFIVIAGSEPCRTFDPTWVQLPPEPLAYMGSRVDEYSRRSHELAERSNRLKLALETARSDLSLREGELARTRAEHDRAREESARLWAELQSLKNDGPAVAARDELAARVRRLELALEAAREQAAESDARVVRHREQLEAAHKARLEVDAQLLAAQEAARLESARREELAKLLQDSGSRLARTRDERRAVDEDMATIRLELQRSQAAHRTAIEEINACNAQLEGARERELRLADEVSRLSGESHGRTAEIVQAKALAESAKAQLAFVRAELEAAVRASAADSEALRQAREVVELEKRRAHEAALSSARAAAEVELAASLSEIGRLSGELEAARAEEKRLKESGAELEKKLAEARDTSGLERLQRQLAEARARADQLQSDLTTAAAAESSFRERSEKTLSELQEECSSLRAERDQSRARWTEQEVALEDLRRTTEEQTSAAQERESAMRKEVARLSREVERSEQDAAASARARDSIRVDAQLAANRAAEREQRVAELAGRLHELESKLGEAGERSAAHEKEKSELSEKIEALNAESLTIRGRLEAREAELLGGERQLKSSLHSAEAATAAAQSELAAERARANQAEEQVRWAREQAEQGVREARQVAEGQVRDARQAAEAQVREARQAAARLAKELEAARGREESAGAESRILAGERQRLSAQVEHLESERARLAEKLEAAQAEVERISRRPSVESNRDREVDLATAIADRENKLDILQRRLVAQDNELAALRRSLARTPSNQVQQIYERATAELSAVKAGLLRREVESSGGTRSQVPGPATDPADKG